MIKFETKTVKIGQEKKGAVLLLISLSDEKKNPKAKGGLQKLSKALRHSNISLENKEKGAE